MVKNFFPHLSELLIRAYSENLVKLPQLGVLTYGLTGTLKILLNSELWLTGRNKGGGSGL